MAWRGQSVVASWILARSSSGCWYTVTGSVSRTGLAAWARAEGIVPSRGKR